MRTGCNINSSCDTDSSLKFRLLLITMDFDDSSPLALKSAFALNNSLYMSLSSYQVVPERATNPQWHVLCQRHGPHISQHSLPPPILGFASTSSLLSTPFLSLSLSLLPFLSSLPLSFFPSSFPFFLHSFQTLHQTLFQKCIPLNILSISSNSDS